MHNSGEGGTQYLSFKPFTVNEVMQHIGLYILHGIAPSPQIEMKLESSQMNLANGNDFCFSSFGSNAKLRHKHFKLYFACVDPLKQTPPRKTHPNWKCQPIFKHIIDICKNAIVLGQYISADEQTIGCKGRHPDILRINYKKEGDGFHCDSICSDGYTFTFFFETNLPPKNILTET